MPFIRAYATAIFVTLATLSFASEEEDANEVWIDGSSFYKSIAHKEKSTIYFKEWSSFAQQFLEDDNYYVALQLDQTFEPIPIEGHEIPTLTSLSAISSDSVLNAYFTFLEQYGRTYGINYMILPDTNELSSYEKQVIEKANKKSPYYFLPKSFLSSTIPESKKDFANEIQEYPTIWVATQDMNLRKIRKWSSKHLDRDQFQYFAQLRSARENEFIPATRISDKLKREVFESGVFAIDEFNNFPLREKAVTYLGDDDELRKWLSYYVRVFDDRREGVKTIVDLRTGDDEINEGDIIIAKYLQETQGISQLIMPISIENEALIVCKMLFGAQGIYGHHEKARIINDPRYIGFSSPLNEGMNLEFISAIDSLSQYAIAGLATPGMQLAVVKNGSLIYQNAYGHYTYDSLRSVDSATLYDLASVTKVMATLPAVALLIDRGMLSLDDSVSKHLPDFEGSNKSGVTIRELLAHNGGLRSYIPFWRVVMDGDRLDPFYYKTPEDEAMDIRTYGLEPDPILLDTLKSFLVQSNLIKNPQNYNYSDLGFMVLHLVVEAVAGLPFNQFLEDEFYSPMGLTRTLFNPQSVGFTKDEIAPTEYDTRFRNYQVWGEVHDRNATVFGGVAGHAGLFSNATDIAKMMSMLMNGGYYGGRRYISSGVLNQFNFRYFERNRRGLGWDKKDWDKDTASKYASDFSFGHTGFTGTMVWADPEEDLIFVFLSNRIFPSAENNRLSEYNTRTLIHDMIYESINPTY